MQLLHASLLSSSHEHYHLDMNIFLDHIIVYPRHAFEAQSSQHCQLIQGFVQKEGTSFYLGIVSCWSCFIQAGVLGLSFLPCFLFAQLTPIANKSWTP
ncbi:hypothetical protein KY290_019357 [Solanum tuberosum]|uniref:Uncharacterized protein n=1 Tax=Solanum tuberosum TaxID=4113 RepID=A0ABQ7VI62_SOLTU|nr:hypothetical protein KY284_018310 [Solanum tuberosum]KAH0704035.1 hypothetical protein KY285_018313 [Solanum tuberosum]KAH0763284.1 hypothetical protein KY290_019357 [Solanum tuberosum]